MSKLAAVFGCATLIVGSMFVFTDTAEAHPPIGFRAARRTARVASRGVRGASRVTYRAAAAPVYRSHVRHSYSPYSPYSPYSRYSPYGGVISSPRYAPAPVYVSPRLYRPSYGIYIGF